MKKQKEDLNNPFEFKCIREDHNCIKCMPDFKVNEEGQKIAEELEKSGVKTEHHLFCPRKWMNSPIHKQVVKFLERKHKSEERSYKDLMKFGVPLK